MRWIDYFKYILKPFILSTAWYSSSYQYLGSNFIDSLCNGVYFFQVSDSLGCSIADTITLGTISGCTDPTAFNYLWTANQDDGSCVPIIYGCTDSIGTYNYDSLANIDDGSCCYITQSFTQIGHDMMENHLMIIVDIQYH